jgi:hypothetical protein
MRAGSYDSSQLSGCLMEATGMGHLRLFRKIGVLIVAAAIFSARGTAQGPMDPGQLPGATSFYLLWHGAPKGEIRQNSSLYALWDDPAFGAARASFLELFLNNAKVPKEKPTLTREEIAQYISLLDNAFVVGYVRRPETRATAKSSTGQAVPAPAWNGGFFVYDRSGKEELLSKAVLQLRGSEKEIPKLTTLTLAGVSALKIEGKNGTTYWAEFGTYAVAANEQSVFEDIVNLVNGKRGSSTLAQSPAFQEAKPLLNGGVVEFFLNISSFTKVALDSPDSMVAQAKPLLAALKLDYLHSFAGHISLEGTKTRIRAALLGDTTPGGLFDIWAEGQASPVSLGHATPETIYYGESQFDLPAFYATIKRTLAQASIFSPQTTAATEAAAETRIGMPLSDALGLPTGEIAYLQSSPTLDESQKVYLLGIRNKPNALKLARTLIGERISSERNEGDTTYLKVSLQGGQSSAGVAQWKFYYLAMTPTLLFGSSKSETLQGYVGQTPASADAPRAKNILAARGQFPEKLNGFSYFDFQKLDWAGLKAKWTAEANKAAENEKSSEAANKDKKFADWLSQVSPEVFPRHLHVMTGASWKDAKGVYFDQWLE